MMFFWICLIPFPSLNVTLKGTHTLILTLLHNIGKQGLLRHKTVFQVTCCRFHVESRLKSVFGSLGKTQSRKTIVAKKGNGTVDHDSEDICPQPRFSFIPLHLRRNCADMKSEQMENRKPYLIWVLRYNLSLRNYHPLMS